MVIKMKLSVYIADRKKQMKLICSLKYECSAQALIALLVEKGSIDYIWEILQVRALVEGANRALSAL